MNKGTDYLRLGDLKLKVISGISSMSEASGYDYVEHALVSGKNTLQAMGSQLKKVSLTIELKGYINKRITAMIETLSGMRDSGEGQRLLFGDGTYKGSFVLTRMNSKVSKTYDDGTLSDVTIELSLTEAVTRETVKVRRVERKETKVAVGRPTTPANIIPNPVTTEDASYKSFFDGLTISPL